MPRSVEHNLLSIIASGHPRILDVMRLLPEGSWFSNDTCGRAYDIIISAFKRYGTVEITLLDRPFKDAGMVDFFIDYIITPADGDPVILAHVVVEQRVNRETVKLGHELVQSKVEDDPYETLATAHQKVMELQGLFHGDSIVPIQRAADEAIERAEMIRSGKNPSLIRFGFIDIDNATGGLSGGDLGVVSGMEKSGKTTFALQTQQHNAESNVASILFSGEMKRVQIVMRLALAEAKIDYVKFMGNKLSPLQWDAYNAAATRIGALPIFIRDGVFTTLDIEAEIERFVDKGAKLLVVDYIQRVLPLAKKGANREQEVAEISRRLKDIALKYNIAVLALSQVNEDMRARESRGIEQDMDKMIVIQREDGASIADIKLRQRFGRSGNFKDMKLGYDTNTGLWHNYSQQIELAPVVPAATGKDDDELFF